MTTRARRLLLTGMSGTGKSSVIGRLAELGYKTVDMDDAGWSEYASDGEWVWREDRLQQLLSSLTEGDVLFVSGCAINQGRFYPQFDAVILLSAPAEVIVERLRTRTNNPFGKHPDELAATLNNLTEIEPLLRKDADYEIVTTLPLDEVVATLLKLVESVS